MKLHDILVFWTIICGKCDIEPNHKVTWNETQMTRQGNAQCEIPTYRLHKNFWKRSIMFYNILSRKIYLNEDANLEQNLTRLY